MSRMFGTDGVRGVANEELTPLLAMQLGQAGAYVLTRENKHKPTIMVGCDTRMSGDMLANALMAGICSVGANAVYVGVIPTPAIAYLTKKYKVEAGVVISASHNPMEFNGIKFFDGNGYKLPDALEDEIEALIKNNMNRVEFPTGSSVGRIKYRKDAREEYINHAVRAVPVDLTNLKVVVDCAEGASHYTSIEALRQLGAQVVRFTICRMARISMQTVVQPIWKSCRPALFTKRQTSVWRLTAMQTACWQWMSWATSWMVIRSWRL